MPGMRSFPEFTRIDLLLRKHGIAQWGVADNDPPLHLSPRLPRAIALLAGFQTKSLADIENGPTEAYFIEYKRLNALLNKAAAALVRHLEKSGHSASLVEATLEEYDQVEIGGMRGFLPIRLPQPRQGSAGLVKPPFSSHRYWGQEFVSQQYSQILISRRGLQ